MPCTGLFHPLGTLARSSTLEEFYAWLLAEERLVLRFLEDCTAQICASLATIRPKSLADPPVFTTYALEMLIPPWLGKAHFGKFVFPFDQRVNAAVHQLGGRHRAHCHGNSGQFLELFADMGIDAVEPVKARRLHIGIAGIPGRLGAHLIGKDEHDVGMCHWVASRLQRAVAPRRQHVCPVP